MWAQSHMPVSTEIRPSQHMLGRGQLICGKLAGGCTEVTLQPPLQRSTVLPECVIAAMLPWQPARRPQSMPSRVPTNSTMSPRFLTLSISESQTLGLLPKFLDWGLTRG